MSSYIIDGPTLIGDTTTSNTLQGTLLLPQVTTAVGDMIYCDNVNGNQVRIPIGTNAQVLTVVGGVPTWADDLNSIDNGFSAALTANQIVLAAAATTPVEIQGFTASAPGFDTTGGWFASGQAAGIWTPGTAGKYRVDITVAFSNTDGTNSSNVGNRTVAFRVNGTSYITKTFQPTGNKLSVQQVNFGTDVVLTNTDTLSVQLSSSTTNGGMTVLPAGTVFAVARYV